MNEPMPGRTAIDQPEPVHDYGLAGKSATLGKRSYQGFLDNCAHVAALTLVDEYLQGLFEGSPPDGFEMQDRALELGLIKSVTVTESCGDYCACADAGFPAECLRRTFKRPVAAAPLPPKEQP